MSKQVMQRALDALLIACKRALNYSNNVGKAEGVLFDDDGDLPAIEVAIAGIGVGNDYFSASNASLRWLPALLPSQKFTTAPNAAPNAPSMIKRGSVGLYS